MGVRKRGEKCGSRVSGTYMLGNAKIGRHILENLLDKNKCLC